MKTRAMKLPLLAAVGAMIFLSGPAQAQDALGAGDALDANLGRFTGGRNLPSPVPDFRARNLIVTGDVAGGRGFRGTVGYSAAGDFSAELGSDDLFDFRARSFPSSPQMAQYSSQQFWLGQDLGLMEFRRDMAVPRAGRVGESLLPRDDEFRLDRMRGVERFLPPMADELRLDSLTQAATAGRALDLAAEPRAIGVMRGEEGTAALVTVSALRGVRADPLQQRMAMEGLTTWDHARLIDDVIAGRPTGPIGQPFEAGFQQIGEDRRLDPGRQFDPAGRDEAGEYGRLLERIVQRYAHVDDVRIHFDQNMLGRLDDRFADLRKELLEREQRRLTAPEAPVAALPGMEDDPLALTLPERIEDRLGPGVLPRPETRDPMEIGDIAPLLRHGQRVDQLTGQARTRFNELMSLAEQSLRRGDYFTAEQRFVRALRFSPGHPLAMAGLAHAQIGAGLNISASLVLQRLLINHPELIDTRFGPEVLPDQARLRQVMRDLEDRLPEPRGRASIGFLLAYLGHQLGETEAMASGLKAMQEAAPDSALLPLLEAIWLGPRDDERSPLAPPPGADSRENAVPEK